VSVRQVAALTRRAIIEKLPQGDDDEEIVFTRSASQRKIDDEDGE
jgi:hypothetical protein